MATPDSLLLWIPGFSHTTKCVRKVKTFLSELKFIHHSLITGPFVTTLVSYHELDGKYLEATFSHENKRLEVDYDINVSGTYAVIAAKNIKVTRRGFSVLKIAVVKTYL